MEYVTVCGLEVHTELATKTKIFCNCTTEFGGEPNTHVCPVCLGLPGTLPTLNRKAVELSVCAGLAAEVLDLKPLASFLNGCAAALRLLIAAVCSVGAVAVVSAAVVLCVRGAYA